MEWLSQNWLWLVLIVGVLMLLSRGRQGGMMGGCCGMAHEAAADKNQEPSAEIARPPPEKDHKAATAAERSPSSRHQGHGGCC